MDFWIGLDGQGAATVEQTGIEVTCVWNASKRKYNSPRYRGWYEMFPDGPVYPETGSRH